MGQPTENLRELYHSQPNKDILKLKSPSLLLFASLIITVFKIILFQMGYIAHLGLPSDSYVWHYLQSKFENISIGDHLILI